ncbi:MAG: CAP domain-containing protein [Treponema sp.]|nr:CAP domain-containing protein [Treponema sp.]
MNKAVFQGQNLLLLTLLCSLFLSCETVRSGLESVSNSISGAAGNLSVSSTKGGAGNSTGASKGASNGDNSERRGDPDSANWDIEKLDTARDADYLKGIEKDVILEMNKVRTDPKKYAELYIQPRLKYYDGKNYSQPGEITIVTQEGKKAVEICAAALLKAKAVGILNPELGLALATRDHAADQGKTGQTGHNGSDKSTPAGRCARYGKGNYIGENIAYGDKSGRDIVTSLLIDDGVPSRGHRLNIMKADYTQTGAAFGIHPEYRTMCVIVYAKGYTSSEPQNSRPSGDVAPAKTTGTATAGGKTDSGLINDAINHGNCAALYAYLERGKENIDAKLAATVTSALKRYTTADTGVTKYRTGRMEAKIRRVPKELAEKVFDDPDAALPGLVSFLVNGVSDQFLKTKILHDWICDNIAYDTEMYFSGRTTAQDYASVLKKKKAVCAGYTDVFNRMCGLAGITSIGIEGYSKSFGYTGSIDKEPDHAWNAVKLGNKWYLVDVTWDAGQVDKRTFIKEYSTGWLFLDSRSFLYSHLPEEDRYQFYAPVLSSGDFTREAYITGEFFQYGLALKPDGPGYNNLIEGAFDFDIVLRNANVLLLSKLRTPEQDDINGASWQRRKGATVTFSFDIPDTREYKAHVFAGRQNEARLQSKVDIGIFENEWLPGAERLFEEKKITAKELELFTRSYFKVAENNSYYFIEDQFNITRNNAVLKISRLLDLSTNWYKSVLTFNIKAAPGYQGFGVNAVKFPYAFTAYNDASNTELLSPVSGILKTGISESFSVSSTNYKNIAFIIDGEVIQFSKNSRGAKFELTYQLPSGLTELILYGSRDGRNYSGLIRYGIEE